VCGETLSLSSKPQPKLEFNSQVLRDEKLLVNEVEKILSLPPHIVRTIIGKHSKTAYRRVHEIVASALDRLIASAKYDPSLLIDLSKALIMVRYQAAREQLPDAIANYIDSMLRSIIDTAKTSWSEAKGFAEKARTILDALAVLIYEYAR
jgi:ATP-dependent Zn protease